MYTDENPKYKRVGINIYKKGNPKVTVRKISEPKDYADSAKENGIK